MSRELHSPTDRRRFLKGAAAPWPSPPPPPHRHPRPARPRRRHRRLPDFDPIPTTSASPTPNTDGYHVGRIDGNLYWVTDSYYQAMFLTTTRGVVLVDAPPTIGHNLLRAIDDITRTTG
ncbi:hypothetical protein ACFQ51_55150 [Streptomyces kaempferi]